jgi:phosphoribosylanthranilate isomerase
MTVVKICGITRLQDALHAAAAGADMLGLNFYRKSPRYIPVDDAARLAQALRAELGNAAPLLVGVFVNEVVANISSISNKVGLNFCQLSGDESADMLRELRGIAYKAIQPQNMAAALDDAGYFAPSMPASERAPSLLLDAYHPDLRGGTGATASREIALALKARVPRLMLAGGLTPDNVAQHVAAVQPWGVDVASGVEDGIPGQKDAGMVTAFIANAKGV